MKKFIARFAEEEIEPQEESVILNYPDSHGAMKDIHTDLYLVPMLGESEARNLHAAEQIYYRHRDASPLLVVFAVAGYPERYAVAFTSMDIGMHDMERKGSTYLWDIIIPDDHNIGEVQYPRIGNPPSPLGGGRIWYYREVTAWRVIIGPEAPKRVFPEAGEDWYDVALREMIAELRKEIEITDYDYMGGVVMATVDNRAAMNGESEWLVFKNDDEAYRGAVQYVKDDLENDPEVFNASFIFDHLREDDFENYLRNDYQEYCTEQDDEDLMAYIDDEEWEEADADGRRKLMDNAIEQCIDNKVEDAMAEGMETYFRGLFGEHAVREALNTLSLDVDEAARDAVHMDGPDHFLDRYDGERLELPHGAVAFGWN